MAKHRHLLVDRDARTGRHTSTSGGGSEREYRYPARNPSVHAAKLRQELEQARSEAAKEATGLHIRELVLEFIGAGGAGLESESLNDEVAGLELLSVREESGVTYATVFVPEEGIAKFLKKIDEYEKERTGKGEPYYKALMESLEGVRLPVLRSFWTDDPAKFPTNATLPFWWEVWLRRSAANGPNSDLIPDWFRADAERAGLRILPGVTRFPERVVFLMHGTAAQWAGSFNLLFPLAELRKASEIPADYAQLPAKDQADWIAGVLQRLTPPPVGAPAVCLVDTGCNQLHPLLQPVLDASDCHVWHPEWNRADQSGHGTEMAGIVAYGSDLAGLLSGSSPIVLKHRLESVKFLNDFAPHDPENYGNATVKGVALVESHRPERPRVVCLLTTASESEDGAPHLWSAALDQHASGALDDTRRLYVVSGGNIRDYLQQPYSYPESNQSLFRIEDPAQAYNVLTVGGYTRRTTLSAAHSGRECIAPADALSPLSRTSMAWDTKDVRAGTGDWSTWPLKPDVVMEAGNYLRDPDGRPEACDDLHLLTTRVAPTGQLLTTCGDTSAAAAQGAKMAAELMADYPTYWPETIRALIVHSAEWTDRMRNEFSGTPQVATRRRLRCYGYGVPDIERARYTVNNRVSLIVQDTLQPFAKLESEVRTNEYKLYELPWPKKILEQLSAADVTVKITLSYFIQPSPARRGLPSKFRYASHGLRFAMRGPTEPDADFAKRISKTTWTEEEKAKASERTVDRPETGEPQQWAVGSHVRTRGSIHCDWWTESAANIAACGAIAVFPVTGWWKERPHLREYRRKARYSLVVTLSTEDESVDLYTPIAQQTATIVST
jgi:hypothetical protein